MLGKISDVRFGFIQDTPLFGLTLTFSLEGGTSFVQSSELSFNASKHNEHCKWSLADQSLYASMTMLEIVDLLRKAKVDDIMKLKNVPVDVTLENRTFKSFRILTEVL